jgi:hypothetical protein
MKRLIKDILNNKPSAAIRAMIDGLKEQSLRDNFVIDMSTFGGLSTRDYSLCVGCAATCAAQKIAKKNLTVQTISDVELRADALSFSCYDMAKFEKAVDRLRHGAVLPLFTYFNLSGYVVIPPIRLPFLTTDDWQENLFPYEAYAEQLEALGL